MATFSPYPPPLAPAAARRLPHPDALADARRRTEVELGPAVQLLEAEAEGKQPRAALLPAPGPNRLRSPTADRRKVEAAWRDHQVPLVAAADHRGDRGRVPRRHPPPTGGGLLVEVEVVEAEAADQEGTSPHADSPLSTAPGAIDAGTSSEQLASADLRQRLPSHCIEVCICQVSAHVATRSRFFKLWWSFE